MTRKNLSIWLKFVIIGVGLCGLAVYTMLLPDVLFDIFPDGTTATVWLVFLCATGLPCYAVLVLAWLISSNIGRDDSFCTKNARLLSAISFLAAGNALLLFVGTVILGAIDRSMPNVTAFALLVVFAGVAVSIAFAALSHLVLKAAEMKEENDLTI